MISKTSFFNSGIYKSTVKRYAWGSILYFIVLFLSSVLTVLLDSERRFEHLPADYFSSNPIILSSSYIGLPILMAICVPTVVAVMIFRFIHSKNQAVFVHSLPVSRRANYVSSVAAAFTLMFVPVILNGIILAFISLCGYGNYFSVSDCMSWIGYNLFGIFIMFSCAVFSANLTGNSFAAVAINFLIHTFLFAFAASIGTMADKFIFGFAGMDNLFESISNNNFAYFTFGFTDKYFREDITLWKYIEFALASLILYIASYYLYKNRKLEAAGDVAGYKCLNSVFKYFVTTIATALCFAVFSGYIGDNNTVFALIVIIISLVAYVASEMILKKTLNVLYSWKGYTVFAFVFLSVVLFISQTSFFGFETRVPQKDNIKEAAVYNYYYGQEEPFTDSEKIIDMALKLHSEKAGGDIPKTFESIYNRNENYTNIHIKYKLENDKTFEREYMVTLKESDNIMGEFYKDDDYKKKCEEIFMDDSKILELYVEYENKVKNSDELIEAIRSDVLSLDYKDLHPYEYNSYETIYSVRLVYKTDNNYSTEAEQVVNNAHISLTSKYKNAIKWLDENGYSAFKRAVSDKDTEIVKYK